MATTSVIVPKHEQSYPTKLLPHRLEEYVRAAGLPPSQDRAFAIRVGGQEVFDAIEHAFVATGKFNAIDTRYFVGTVFHEAGAKNEWDTEIATSSSPSGFVSVGCYQIGEEEASRYGYSLEDMLDLDKASACMVNLANDNRMALRKYAGIAPGDPDPDYTDHTDGVVWKGGTMRAYLAIAHNHGLGYSKATITSYGMDWDAYRKRNPKDNIVAHGYGADCITGGPFYPHEIVVPTGTLPAFQPGMRVLVLHTQAPYMTGTDVQELQRHLRLFNPTLGTDGVYGPKTEVEVLRFQHLVHLEPDGKVGHETWSKILSQKLPA